MPKLVLKNASVFIGALDLSANVNQVAVDASADELDVTTFGSAGFYECLGGIDKVRSTPRASEAGASVQPAGGFPGSASAPSTRYDHDHHPNPWCAGDIAYLVVSLRRAANSVGWAGGKDRPPLAGAGRSSAGRSLSDGRRTTTGCPPVPARPPWSPCSASPSRSTCSPSRTPPTLDLIIQSDTSNAFAAPTTRFTVPVHALVFGTAATTPPSTARSSTPGGVQRHRRRTRASVHLPRRDRDRVMRLLRARPPLAHQRFTRSEWRLRSSGSALRRFSSSDLRRDVRARAGAA
jgi:hypothetical protein